MFQGIKTCEQTKYITKVLYRLSFSVGSIFLAVISMTDEQSNFMGLPQSIQIGGTSLLIVIGVAIETMKSL